MLIPVDSILDARLDFYRRVKDRALIPEGVFLAEGEIVVRRLLASSFPASGLLVSLVLADKRVADIAPLIPTHDLPQDVPVYVLPGESISDLLGFKFHSGIIAVGRIPPRIALADVLPATGPVRIVVLPEIGDAENLGTIIRLAAGLGAHFILTGQRCAPAWHRRTVRVSMGTIFNIPIVESPDIMADLARLAAANVELIATVVNDPTSEVLGTRPFAGRVALLFGTEAPGLSPGEITACHRRVTIPMHLAVDSLNVGIAAGIFMWEVFSRPNR